MKNLFTGLTLWIAMVVFAFWAFRREFSLFSRGRKKIKPRYLLPLFFYLVLTLLFARPIIEFIGPATIEVLSIPLGAITVHWVHPTLNVLFFIVYFLNIFSLLTLWEPVVKFSETMIYLLPPLIFAVIILGLLFLFAAVTSASAIKLVSVWLFFMFSTYSLTTIIIIGDLKKQFAQEMNARQVQRDREKTSGKNKKKILFLAPVADLAAGFGHHMYYRFPPLSLGILSALTPRNAFHVALIDEQFETFTYQDADLVAITAITTHATRAYDIAAVYRARGIPVVMGGIHVSMMTEEALQFVDTVVVGEAEEIWPKVLEDFLAHALKPVYRGQYPALHNRVIPDRSLFDEHYLMSSLQTSRGCPWNCDFCSVTQFNGRRYRQRPVEEVLDEIATIPNRYFLFVDDNLIGYSKRAEKRALELFQGMVKRKLAKRWIAQVTVDIGTKPELLRWAAKSGCIFLFIGLEYTDKEQLQEINKHFAAKINYPDALKQINRHGIGVLGAFMYGGKLETEKKMMERARFIARNRVDMIQQTILTPLPGTRLFQTLQSEGRLLYTNYPHDWEKYNGLSLLYQPHAMSAERFLATYQRCLSHTYAFFKIWGKAIRTLIHTRRLDITAGALRLNFAYRSYAIRNMEKQNQWQGEKQKGETS